MFAKPAPHPYAVIVPESACGAELFTAGARMGKAAFANPEVEGIKNVKGINKT